MGTQIRGIDLRGRARKRRRGGRGEGNKEGVTTLTWKLTDWTSTSVPDMGQRALRAAQARRRAAGTSRWDGEERGRKTSRER